MGARGMKDLKGRRSGKGLLVSLFAIAMLVAPVSIQVQGTTSVSQLTAVKEETVLVPLVEGEEKTGIPVNPFVYYIAIRLISPPGQELQVPLDEPTADVSQGHITVLIIYRGNVETEEIQLQDWPQNGPVIPLSQDWPQGGLLLIPIINEPEKSYLCIEIEQDWPQDMVPGQLI